MKVVFVKTITWQPFSFRNKLDQKKSKKEGKKKTTEKGK